MLSSGYPRAATDFAELPKVTADGTERDWPVRPGLLRRPGTRVSHHYVG